VVIAGSSASARCDAAIRPEHKVDVCFWHKADIQVGRSMSAFGVKADILFATGLGALDLLRWRGKRKRLLTTPSV
jgi:hypothetical protein